MAAETLFPESITQYRCPACGKVVRGSYNLDEGRTRCTKTWHRRVPIGQKYVIAAPGHDLKEER